MTLSYRPFWSFDGRRMSLEYLSAGGRYTTGRKTDVKDAAWIAELLRHGLLRGSFIPSKPQRQLRELTRYRSTLAGVYGAI
jgi:Transposase